MTACGGGAKVFRSVVIEGEGLRARNGENKAAAAISERAQAGWISVRHAEVRAIASFEG